MLTVATANVNGIRAAFRRGMGPWIETRKPDVLLLQEVRAPQEMVGDFLSPDEWHLAHHECMTKGRAGVAIASRLPMSAVRVGLDQGVVTNSGRWVEADLELPGGGLLTVVSTYIHSGTVGTPSMEEKYAFLDLVTARMDELRADGRYAVVAGDVNIAHRTIDIKNWKGNLKAAGFLPQERAYLDRWFGAGERDAETPDADAADAGAWVDLGRRLGGDGPGPYTWWSWRGQAYDNDSGWRIDYQIATPSLAERALKAEVDRAPSYAERWSDHAPLLVTYDL